MQGTKAHLNAGLRRIGGSFLSNDRNAVNQKVAREDAPQLRSESVHVSSSMS
jgi:hypothetical protein